MPKASLTSLDKHAKVFAPSARATVEANKELCAWLLDPLARWAQAAYGERAFDDAAKGYARYCLGVWKAQQLYEKAGRYTPQELPDIISGVYEDEGYMVPYMWAAILDLSVLALGGPAHCPVPGRVPEGVCRPMPICWNWPAVMA